MEQKKRDGRGGARRGSGPRRRRLFLDTETAKLLGEHLQQLNEPDLTEEEAIKRLLQIAQAQREMIHETIQEVFQQYWQSLVDLLLSTVGSQLQALESQIFDQVQETVHRRMKERRNPK